jgi:hypothetical protein
MEVFTAYQQSAKQFPARRATDGGKPSYLSTNAFIQVQQIPRQIDKLLFEPAGRQGIRASMRQTLHAPRRRAVAVIMQGG